MQLQATAAGFRAQLSNLGKDVSTRKTELYTELTETARTFSDQLTGMRSELSEQQSETLGIVQALQGEFTREIESLQSGIGGEREQLMTSLLNIQDSFSNELAGVRNTVFGRRDIIIEKLNSFDARLGEQIGELAQAATERQQTAQERLGQAHQRNAFVRGQPVFGQEHLHHTRIGGSAHRLDQPCCGGMDGLPVLLRQGGHVDEGRQTGCGVCLAVLVDGVRAVHGLFPSRYGQRIRETAAQFAESGHHDP